VKTGIPNTEQNPYYITTKKKYANVNEEGILLKINQWANEE
jgi:hypothetical protein